MGGKEVRSCYAYIIDAMSLYLYKHMQTVPLPPSYGFFFFMWPTCPIFFLSLLFKLHAQLHIQSLSLERRVSFELIILLNVIPLFNYLSLKLKIYHPM